MFTRLSLYIWPGLRMLRFSSTEGLKGTDLG